MICSNWCSRKCRAVDDSMTASRRREMVGILLDSRESNCCCRHWIPQSPSRDNGNQPDFGRGVDSKPQSQAPRIACDIDEDRLLLSRALCCGLRGSSSTTAAKGRCSIVPLVHESPKSKETKTTKTKTTTSARPNKASKPYLLDVETLRLPRSRPPATAQQ